MSRNILIILFILFITASCHKINDFYSDVDNSSKELIKLKDSNLELAVSAIKNDESLTITLYIHVLNNSINYNDIDIKIDGLENLNSKRELEYKDNWEKFNFNSFAEIKNIFDKRIETKMIMYCRFEDQNLLSLDDLNFTIIVKSNLGTSRKKISMERHSRYSIIKC